MTTQISQWPLIASRILVPMPTTRLKCVPGTRLDGQNQTQSLSSGQQKVGVQDFVILMQGGSGWGTWYNCCLWLYILGSLLMWYICTQVMQQQYVCVYVYVCLCVCVCVCVYVYGLVTLIMCTKMFLVSCLQGLADKRLVVVMGNTFYCDNN